MGTNGIVTETAHLHTNKAKQDAGWERIWGKKDKEQPVTVKYSECSVEFSGRDADMDLFLDEISTIALKYLVDTKIGIIYEK